jgi:hypothetical protein
VLEAVLTMFAEQRHSTTIGIPYGVLDWWRVNLSQIFLLLDVVKDDGGRGAKEEGCCPAVEDIICLDRRFYDRLDFIVEVSNLDGLKESSTYEPIINYCK